MKKYPKIGIVILNYVTYQLTVNLVNSLTDLDYDNFFVVIVDNKSPNNSYHELLKFTNSNEYLFDIYLIESDKNGGYSYGNNIGAKKAYEVGAKYTAIMNNDLEFPNKNLLKNLVVPLENNNEYVVSCPLILDSNNMPEKPILFNRRNIFYDTFDFILIPLNNAVKSRKKSEGFEDKILMGSGCCFLINSIFFKKIGYFDEALFMYGEEYILGEKIYQANKKLKYLTNIHVIHKHRLTTSKFYKERNILKMGRKAKLYYYRNYRKVNIIFLIIWYFRFWFEAEFYKRFILRTYVK
ncbi:MAG: glycosyltransferase family 2 protein [Candidatus Cloacimonadales bacterium]|jgi:GT2 family glycosyltransferase|nr:glycosyltransferase family 2 protein [Candidatus Cloacimonadota bacterium]MDD3500818.1 glycosyltransferase family 2 protein [Candidatus Cloacimonadota bacterium]MDX9978065.1 glycosyltransferase family 2 protein [Candidatus Cloacimonadales bacterium]